MGIKHIVRGHLKELLRHDESLYDERMAICRICPLFKDSMGGICNPRLWLDPTTGIVSNKYKEGFYKGCGCRLRAKTRLESVHCPANKW